MNLLERLLYVVNALKLRPRLSWTFWTKWTGYVQPDVKGFIDKIRPAALEVESKTGIPWRFAMVQAYHESRYGQSLLTKEANNLFGITGDTWYQAGKPVYWIETTEYSKDKVPFRIRRPFRHYDSWQASLDDWAGLIQRRYPDALAAAKKGDFPAFAHALQAEGYATDPKYATQLVQINSELESIA